MIFVMMELGRWELGRRQRRGIDEEAKSHICVFVFDCVWRQSISWLCSAQLATNLRYESNFFFYFSFLIFFLLLLYFYQHFLPRSVVSWLVLMKLSRATGVLTFRVVRRSGSGLGSEFLGLYTTKSLLLLLS
jgi:hypothetical protein